MKKIEISLEHFKVGKKITGPKHPFAEAIEQVILFMGEDNKRYGYWCGRLKKFSPAEVNDMLKEAKSWQVNPKALFQKILKQRLTK